MTGLEQAALREIVELHALFTSWLGHGRGDLGRIDAALAPMFHMIDPEGAAVDRAGVLAGLRAAGGRRGPAFRIAIEDAQARDLGGQHVLATYVERQQDAHSGTTRRSSALFCGSAGAPQGVAWLHLHETWIAAPSRGR